MNVLVRKLILFINDEMIKKNMNFEIFSYPNVTKGYSKIIKIAMILLIFLKFILLDFNYDSNLRSNVKKMLNSINEIILSITENFILNFIKNTNGASGIIQTDIYKEFFEKYQKVIKLHKIKKNPKELFNSLVKNCEGPINVIKQFSKYFIFIN